jgi:hypothetical protein
LQFVERIGIIKWWTTVVEQCCPQHWFQKSVISDRSSVDELSELIGLIA